MDLIVVESPTKARTLSRFLGKKYRLASTMGHIRDLPGKRLGVNVKQDFKPEYVLVPGKREAIRNLKDEAGRTNKLFLATDPDREGEAIAYHVAMICSGQKSKVHAKGRAGKSQKFLRITFHEITKPAIEKALANPGSVNMQLVHAQQARRVLDRLVGYKLSPLLWRKIRRGLSAGRVQSVAVRLVVEREKEIEKFKSEEYWRLLAALAKNKSEPFLAELVAKNSQPYEEKKTVQLFCGSHTIKRTKIGQEKSALAILRDLTAPFVVEKLEKKKALSFPPPPFTTSTLQQTAGYRLGFSSKLTMQLAQGLYERGLITYHRTDSTLLAETAIKRIRQYIQKSLGKQYLPENKRIYKTKSRVAQEAHEGIRPTKAELSAAQLEIKEGLSSRHKRLYDLIWRRAIACQMTPAQWEKTDLEISCGDYQFVSKGQRLLFKGYLRIYFTKASENLLPSLKQGEKLKPVSLGAVKSLTTPPPRYTEATLIKALEERGIGRPSTYAPIVSTIQVRQYVEKEEGKFKSTLLGTTVNDFLVDHFPDIVDLDFTAEMEDNLDEIANGRRKWVPTVRDFYQPFEKKLTGVAEKAKRVAVPTETTGRKCPKCKESLPAGRQGNEIIRTGRFGKFLSCSRFPKCDYTAPYTPKLKGVKCPECGGDVVVKRTRKGKQFYGCSNWPKCKWASWRKPKPEEIGKSSRSE